MITLVLSNDFRSNSSTLRRKSFDKTSELTKKYYKSIEKLIGLVLFSVLFTRKSSLLVVVIFVTDCILSGYRKSL